MTKPIKCELTVDNLAILGALDDFYDGYCTVVQYWSDNKDRILEDEKKEIGAVYARLHSKTRKVFIPILRHYSDLFVEQHRGILISSYGVRVPMVWLAQFPFAVGKFASFNDFLFGLQYAVARTFSYWKFDADPTFHFEDTWDEINHRIRNAVDRAGSQTGVHNAHELSFDETLYVTERLSSTKCYRDKHECIPVRFPARKVCSDEIVFLSTHYCCQCRKHFIGRITLSFYDKHYGKVYAPFQYCDAQSNQFMTYKNESFLHSTGYFAIDGGLTDQERIDHLKWLMTENIMSYFDICAQIEDNIRTFKNRPSHQIAVTKWQKDLQLLSNWVRYSTTET